MNDEKFIINTDNGIILVLTHNKAYILFTLLAEMCRNSHTSC